MHWSRFTHSLLAVEAWWEVDSSLIAQKDYLCYLPSIRHTTIKEDVGQPPTPGLLRYPPSQSDRPGVLL